MTANFSLRSNVFPRNATVPLRHNSFCPYAGTTHCDVLTLFFGILSTFILAHLLSACRRRNSDWRESGSRNGWSFCTPLTSMGNWRSVTRMTQTFHRSAAVGSLSYKLTMLYVYVHRRITETARTRPMHLLRESANCWSNKKLAMKGKQWKKKSEQQKKHIKRKQKQWKQRNFNLQIF